MTQEIPILLSLLTNQNYKKQQQKIHNLMGYTNFKSTDEYRELIFPLFENEHYCSLTKECYRYEKLLLAKIQFPLVYQIDFDVEYGYTIEQGLKLKIIKEKEIIPKGIEYKDNKMWKYNKFSNYLAFKDLNNHIVSIHFWDPKTESVYQSLAIYKKTQQRARYLIMPCCEQTNKIKDYFGLQLQDSEYEINEKKQKLFIYLQPIAPVSTYMNEAESIYRLSNCDFCNLILKPNKQNNILQQTEFSQKVKQQQQLYFSNQDFTTHFNEHQLDGIRDSLDFTKKITIIKGPPGTGKTQTTIGIVSIMAELLNNKNEKGAILILAKSNSVVNDLVRKIVFHKSQPQSIIFCKKEEPNYLNVLRLGRGEMCDNDILRCSLEIQTQDKFFSKLTNDKIPLWKQIYTKYIKLNIQNLMKYYGIINFAEYIEQIKQENNKNNYFSLFVILEYIEGEVNKKSKNSVILNAFGDYYIEMREMLSINKNEVNEIEKIFLQKSNVIVSTLNSCSHDYLKEYFNKIHLRMCIIDEAPTALEPSLLIPFVQFYTLQKIVLLGDTRQLNPITVSNISQNYGYFRSMFERLAKGLKESSFKLRYQYRQMPNLAEITSLMFYKSKLIDGINNMQLPAGIKIKVNENRNRLFFDTPNGTEEDNETSKKNSLEMKAILMLVDYLLKNNPILKPKQITIISAYAAQKTEIEKEFENRNYEGLEFDTVDSFQGKENDIIILSLVRANQKLGFLNDKKRTNVALSRARYCQFIFGNIQTLKKGFANWNKIIELMSQQKEIITYKEQDIQNIEFFKYQLQLQNLNLDNFQTKK